MPSDVADKIVQQAGSKWAKKGAFAIHINVCGLNGAMFVYVGTAVKDANGKLKYPPNKSCAQGYAPLLSWPVLGPGDPTGKYFPVYKFCRPLGLSTKKPKGFSAGPKKVAPAASVKIAPRKQASPAVAAITEQPDSSARRKRAVIVSNPFPDSPSQPGIIVPRRIGYTLASQHPNYIKVAGWGIPGGPGGAPPSTINLMNGAVWRTGSCPNGYALVTTIKAKWVLSEPHADVNICRPIGVGY